jgi:hypothetical protein
MTGCPKNVSNIAISHRAELATSCALLFKQLILITPPQIEGAPFGFSNNGQLIALPRDEVDSLTDGHRSLMGAKNYPQRM